MIDDPRRIEGLKLTLVPKTKSAGKENGGPNQIDVQAKTGAPLEQPASSLFPA